MTMRPPIERRTPGNRRILAGLGVLVVFAALFVLPLCAALALCTMPCCHHDNNATGSVMSGAMAACETQCGIRSVQAKPETVPAVTPGNATPRTSPVAIVVDLPAPPAAPTAFDRDAQPTHRGTDESLHVLNSVFRI